MKIDPSMTQQLQGLKNKKADSLEMVPKAYREVAQGMEEQFIEFMLQQMKNSIQKSEDDSTAMSYYESLITQEQAQAMASQGGGIGIQRLILDQIYPEYMRTEANLRQFDAPRRGHGQYQKMNENMPSKGISSGREK